jgi:hypothetical protein
MFYEDVHLQCFFNLLVDAAAKYVFFLLTKGNLVTETSTKALCAWIYLAPGH